MVRHNGRWHGVVHLRDLVMSDRDRPVEALIDTGGNAGAQSATTLVHAMSVGEVEPADVLRIRLREAAVGVLLGSMLAVISVLPVWLFAGQWIVAVVALTLMSIY